MSISKEDLRFLRSIIDIVFIDIDPTFNDEATLYKFNGNEFEYYLWWDEGVNGEWLASGIDLNDFVVDILEDQTLIPLC